MQPEPRWFALIAVLVAAAVAFPLFSGDIARGIPPAVLALAIGVLLLHSRRSGPESPSDRVRDRRAIAVFMAIALVTAVAAIVVFVVNSL